MNVPRRTCGQVLLGLLSLTAIALTLTACVPDPVQPHAIQTTVIATSTATAQPTPTVTPRPLGNFPCPTTTSASTKSLNDPQFGLSFTYPAAWVENDCNQATAQKIAVGNLFFVSLTPRNGLTVQQFVDANKTSNESITLVPLQDSHAVEAYQVQDTVAYGLNSPPGTFSQTMAIIAGSQNFYVVSSILAQQSSTDTMPGLSNVQLTQQIVSTFQVP